MEDHAPSLKKAYARYTYHVNFVMLIQDNKEAITFTPAYQKEVIMPHNDSSVISIVIAKHSIGRILVDNGNSINLIY